MTENIDLQNLNISNINGITSSSSPASETKGQGVSIKLPEDKSAELCKKYNITLEELYLLLEKCQNEGLDIYQLPDAKINELIGSIQVKTETSSEQTDQKGGTEPVTAKNNSETADQNQFNHQEFYTLSLNEKIDVYALELAKNRFMFSDKDNKKTLEEWNNLSEQEKIKLVKNESEALKNDKVYNLLQDDEMKNQYLQGKMLRLQTASYQNMSLDDFNKQERAELKIEQMYDYTKQLDDNNRTDQLNKIDGALKDESKLIIEYLKEEAKNNSQIQKDFGHLWSEENTAYNLSSQEIEKYLDYVNKNKDVKLTKTDLTLKVMESALKKDPNNAQLKEKYTQLSNFVENIRLKNEEAIEKAKAEGKEYSVPDFGRISSIKTDKDFGKLYESAATAEDKIVLISAYINKACQNTTPDEKASIIHEFVTDLYNQGEEETSILFAKIMLGKYKDSEIENEITNNQDALAYTSVLSGDVSVNGAKNISNTQNELSKENKELSEQYALSSQEVLKVSKNQENIRAVSSNYASFNSIKVQAGWYEIVKDPYIVTAETQMVTYADVLKLSDPEIGNKAAKNIDKTHKKIQLGLHEIAIQNKEYNNAMIKDGTFNRYAKENIVPAFNMHKERCQESDYSHEESVNTLNMLSDQIQNCKDYPDKQLEMHNEIMNLDQNKYSKVIEHTAGNIKNYDPSIQNEAMDAVYATGNQKAIETAVNDITNYSSIDVQEKEYPRTVCETVIQNANEEEFQEKLLSGNLSYQEIAQLTPTQRREYYAEIYRKASATEKIALISKLPNGVQKKTIYTLIALYDQNLLSQMVEQGMGLDMFKACNDVKAQNKIISVMKSSENQTVKEQYREIVADPRNAGLFIGEDFSKAEPKTAKTLNYASIPEGFDKKELFLKDKNGYLLG